MKKHIKTAFGLLGLLLVAITTIFAATIPSPEALAATSVTDTIVVRVIGSTPHVEINSPKDGDVFITPDHTISFVYENVETAVITIEYTDPDGATHEYTLDTIDADYYPGDGSITLNLADDPRFGYGDYVVTITGSHGSALPDEDSIEFSFYPLTATIEEQEKSENADLTLDYNNENEEIETIHIVITDDDGHPVTQLPLIKTTPPNKNVVIPFADNKAPAGDYVIEIYAYDANGNQLGAPYILHYTYNPTIVPNTGGLFVGLNISKADYLITGLLVFFVVGLAGIVFIVKSNKKARRRR